MDAIFKRCAGLDVHKKTVDVCVRVMDESGESSTEVRKFSTMTHDLFEMLDWLLEREVTHVAMESTGVYWKPIYNVLEGHLKVLVVNAAHVKHVPGRKTDVKDCQWLAQLLQHGLLKGSFVPPQENRELRDLTRLRTQVVNEKVRTANRVQKVLEDANVKLASVATDVLGVSGRLMIEAIIAGEDDPVKLADLARKRLRKKIPELKVALEGFVSHHHRRVLRMLMDHLYHTEETIAQLEEEIEAKIAPFSEAVELLIQIPGVDHRTAHVIIAEIGTDMSHFPSAAHLSSWAGLCPGNNESGGKRKSGKTTKGDKWLKTGLCQAACSAVKVNDSYFKSQFHRIARRRGNKKATIAVAHSILVVVYHMLRDGACYEDLGADYFDKHNRERRIKSLVKSLESLGHKVILEEASEAA